MIKNYFDEVKILNFCHFINDETDPQRNKNVINYMIKLQNEILKFLKPINNGWIKQNQNDDVSFLGSYKIVGGFVGCFLSENKIKDELLDNLNLSWNKLFSVVKDCAKDNKLENLNQCNLQRLINGVYLERPFNNPNMSEAMLNNNFYILGEKIRRSELFVSDK